MRRLLLATLVVAALATPAEALTLKDLMELARAGLGDEVLLALIEVDRGVYAIDPATLKELKAAGVSDKVIAALIRSGRDAPPPPAPLPIDAEADAAEPAPQVVVIDHRDDGDRVREVAVPVAVPVYVGVPYRSRHRSGGTVHASDTSTFVPFQSGPPAARPAPKTEPVYWGWGGKRRPDTWDEPEPVRPRDRRK